MDSSGTWHSNVAARLRDALPAMSLRDSIALLAADVRGDAAPPVDVTAIALSRGLRILECPMRADALLEEVEDGFVVRINAAHSVIRQRFSLAHELGHVALFQATGLRQAFGQEEFGDRKEVERLCNMFAAELLMPVQVWRERLLLDGLSLGLIEKLCRSQKVSFEAGCRRAVEVGIWRAAVLVGTSDRDADTFRVDRVYSRVRGLSRKTIEPRQSRNCDESEARSRRTRIGHIAIDTMHGRRRYLAEVREVVDSIHVLLVAEPNARRVLGS